MKRLLIIALSLSGLLCSAQAEQASQESIKQLMQITGAHDIGHKAVDGMIAQLKPLMPAAPESFWEEIKKEVSPDELINVLVPLYQKQLTESEIQAAIVFYQSPEGKKFAAAQPKIHKESMKAVQTWGKSIGNTIVEKYQKANPSADTPAQ